MVFSCSRGSFRPIREGVKGGWGGECEREDGERERERGREGEREREREGG